MLSNGMFQDVQVGVTHTIVVRANGERYRLLQKGGFFAETSKAGCAGGAVLRSAELSSGVLKKWGGQGRHLY